MHPRIKRFKTQLTMTDPCKKCIVRVNCSEVCDDSKIYKNAMGDDPIENKLVAWILVIVFFIEIPWGIITIIFK